MAVFSVTVTLYADMSFIAHYINAWIGDTDSVNAYKTMFTSISRLIAWKTLHVLSNTDKTAGYESRDRKKEKNERGRQNKIFAGCEHFESRIFPGAEYQ